MKNNHLIIRIFVSIIVLSIIFSCRKENTIIIPTVVIVSITDITGSTVNCIGEISADGGSPVKERGICWSLTNPTPTITDNKTTAEGSNSKIFTGSISGLSPGKSYYLRAYATNSIGTAYSSQITFATLTTAPVLTTSELSSITSISVNCGGNITSDGGKPISSRGVCWNIKQNPTIADNKITNGEGVGNFTSSITGLHPNTTYYLRAFASNGQETGYGQEVTFKTLETGIGTVSDIDGNVYNTVNIGSQVWMVENLKTTKYNDGTPIPNNTIWDDLETPAYCWYDNDISNKDTYGALYNWYAVNTGKLCPQGWHIPSNEEWTILSDYLGKESMAGGKLKEPGTTHWISPNEGASGEVGFNAVPGGYRDSNGKFFFQFYRCNYWSTTKINISPSTVWDRNMKYNDTYLNAGSMPMKYGCSVRCIKD